MKWRTRFIVLATALVVLSTLLPGIRRAKAYEQRRHCVENLKQLAVALTLSGNADSPPMTILQLTNSARDPKVFICPSDEARQKVNTWETLAAKGSSYSCDACALSPVRPMPIDTAQNHVMFRCPIHSNVAMMDGSVHMLSRESMTNFVQRSAGVGK